MRWQTEELLLSVARGVGRLAFWVGLGALFVFLAVRNGDARRAAAPTPSAAATSAPSPTESTESPAAPTEQTVPGVMTKTTSLYQEPFTWDLQDVGLARHDLKRAGLQLGAVHDVVTMRWAPGTVLRQRPRPGTIAKIGTHVAVWRAVAPACMPAYPDFCLAPFKPDLDCGDIAHAQFRVDWRYGDPDGFDRDQDGVGCES